MLLATLTCTHIIIIATPKYTSTHIPTHLCQSARPVRYPLAGCTPCGCLAPWAPSGYLHPEGVQPTNPSFLSLHLTLSWPTLCFHIHNNDLLFGSMILSGSRKFLFQTFSEHFMAVLQISDKTTELHVQTPSVAFCAETYLIPRTGFILGCDCRQEVTSATSDSLHTLLTQSNREIKHRLT